MRAKKVLRYISLALLTGTLLVGCSGKKESETSTGKADSIRVGFFPNVTHSQALLGKANGDFQNNIGKDAKIEWKQFNAGPAEIESLLANELDIGYIGPGPAVNGYSASNGDIQIISGATNSGAILISRKDINIKGVKDLNGKKVAIPQYGNTQDLCLRGLLKENGLKDTTRGGTVEVVQAPNPDIKTLIDNKQIDAAFVPEPWGSKLVKEVGAKVVLEHDKTWRDGKYSSAVIVARKDFINKNPEIVEKFLEAHVSLTDYINTHKEEAKEVVNKELHNLTKKSLPQDVLDESFKRLIVTNDPEKQSILDIVDLSRETGFLREKPDLSNLFSLDILNKVLKEKGLESVK